MGTDKYIKVAYGNLVAAKQTREFQIEICDDIGKTFIATLNNVILAQNLCDQLFSIITLMNSGHIYLIIKVFVRFSSVRTNRTD